MNLTNKLVSVISGKSHNSLKLIMDSFNIPLILKTVEGTLAVIVLLFSKYGGLIHLGVDPVVRNLEDIGNVPWGFSHITSNFGLVVETAYVFITFVLIVGMMICSVGPGPMVLSLFNFFGVVFYGSLCVMQHITWSRLSLDKQKVRYRNLIGVAPEWHYPQIPLIMEFTAGLLSCVFLADLGFSYYQLKQQV